MQPLFRAGLISPAMIALSVSQVPPDLNGVRKGDHIDITYTEVVLVTSRGRSDTRPEGEREPWPN